MYIFKQKLLSMHADCMQWNYLSCFRIIFYHFTLHDFSRIIHFFYKMQFFIVSGLHFRSSFCWHHKNALIIFVEKEVSFFRSFKNHSSTSEIVLVGPLVVGLFCFNTTRVFSLKIWMYFYLWNAVLKCGNSLTMTILVAI